MTCRQLARANCGPVARTGRVSSLVSNPCSESMKRLRILVVDDCVELARTLGQLLRRWGQEVTVATDGRQALEAASGLALDAALLDLDLTEMDGFEIAQALRQQPAGEKILLIAVTGRWEEEFRQRAARVGFDYFLTKPVPPRQLKALLHLDARPASG